MKPNKVKNILLGKIKELDKASSDFVTNPEKCFKRNRKLPFSKTLKIILGMGGGTLSSELLDEYEYSSDAPSPSAFIQQRSKIKPEAFETLFHTFTEGIYRPNCSDTIPILAVDGSDIQIATDPSDEASFFPGTNGQKPYNLLHLNALYDLSNHLYIDGILQKARFANEQKAFVDMVDRSPIGKALVIADRGYESYNNLAHIQEKGWFFLIRIKDGNYGIKGGFDLPDTEEFDKHLNLTLTRKQTKATKELIKDKNHYRIISSTTPFDYLPLRSRKHDKTLFYKLSFRIVRFKISDESYETVITNLDSWDYPADKLKKLYASRWGIETSFRDLKYTIGLLNFHSKKVMCIQQEIFARMIMYNFSEMITLHVVIDNKEKKYTYRANFAVAVRMCRRFFCGKTTSPNVEAVIARNLIPIRPDRHRKRNLVNKPFTSFLYRVS